MSRPIWIRDLFSNQDGLRPNGEMSFAFSIIFIDYFIDCIIQNANSQKRKTITMDSLAKPYEPLKYHPPLIQNISAKAGGLKTH